jgi:hypothetical protein
MKHRLSWSAKRAVVMRDESVADTVRHHGPQAHGMHRDPTQNIATCRNACTCVISIMLPDMGNGSGNFQDRTKHSPCPKIASAGTLSSKLGALSLTSVVISIWTMATIPAIKRKKKLPKATIAQCL